MNTNSASQKPNVADPNPTARSGKGGSDQLTDYEDRLLRFFAHVIPRYVPRENVEPFVAALAPGVRDYVGSVAAGAVERILVANFGLAQGRAIFADLTGTADAPNSELVAGVVSRAAVSKAACRIRRGLGLPLRNPAKARPKRGEVDTDRQS